MKIIYMKKYLFITLLALVSTSAFAQLSKENDYGINKLKLEFRTDFDCFSENDVLKSGFTGKYLNFIIAGDINDKLYYAYRQRINKVQTFANFFDATDYLYLGWHLTDGLDITAGKEVIAMGGIEYDLAPIDVYFHSLFWDNFNCYQFGTNLSYTTKDKSNTFTFQFTNSPYSDDLYDGLYNYSIHWRAKFRHFSPVCSANLYEYKKGTFLNVIALGTGFNFGPVEGYLDFANRAHGDQETFFFKDITAIARVGYNFLGNDLEIYVKGGCDINEAQPIDIHYSQIYDFTVLPGCDVVFYGGGFEYFPVKGRNDLRIHAFFAFSDVRRSMELETIPVYGDDGEPVSTLQMLNKNRDNFLSYQINLGLTWRLNYLDK